MHLLAVATLVLLSGVSQAVSEVIKPRHYVCHHARSPIVVDGKLDDSAWRSAKWTEYFVDIEGSKKPEPRFKTRAKMLWDDEYFYVGAELEEPHVWATLIEHDSVIFQDPDFEVFIDPDGDNQNYYEIEINALNTEWDLRLVKAYRDGGPPLNEWEIPGLKHATHVDGTLNDPSDKDKGWSVEYAFPWKALGEFARTPAPPKDGDQWRVNFSRVEWKIDIVDGKYVKVPKTPEDNWVWSPQGVIDMHQPETWGYVQFATDPKARFRPDPTTPAREFLMRVYHAQIAFREGHKRWAASFTELGVTPPLTFLAAPTLAPTEDGYEATVVCKGRGGKRTRVHVRQDSRLWAD